MAMWTPQTLSNGDVNEQSYALGWRFNPDIAQSGDDDKVLSYAHHGGVSKGAMTLASTFAASLELARSGEVELRQGDAFGPIYLRRPPGEG